MARARHAFERAQWAAETVWGTAVPATYIVPGLRTVRYQPTDAIVQAEKLNGSLAQHDGSDVVGKSGQAVLGGYLCPQTLPYLLEAAVHHATPSAGTGVPATQSRVWAPTLTAEDVPISRTIELGSNVAQDHWRLRGALPSTFEITGRLGEFAMWSSTWLGRALEHMDPLSGPLTPTDYTRLKAKNAKFWVDPISGTIGTTPVAGCITEFAYRSGNLWALVNCIDGTLEASGYAQEPQVPQLVLTIQLGADSLAWFNAMEAGTQQLVRMQIDGLPISGGVNERIQIDMAANIIVFPEVGETEAEHGLVAAVTFSGTEDNTGGSFGKLIEYEVINDAATLV